MADPYATPAELATYMQTTLGADETATATMLLGFIATLIRTEFPGIDDRDPAIDPQLPKLVSLELVSRKMLETSSGGAASITEQMDDIVYTSQFHARPYGGLGLDDWARELLTPGVAEGQRAFGIKLSSYGAQ